MSAETSTQPAPAGRHLPSTRVRLVVLLFLALAVGAWWLYETTKPAPSFIAASGTIEAEEATLAVEVGGQVKAFLAEEGQAVKAGQPLATLDTALLEAQIRQAEAAVAVAWANADLVAAGPRPEEIRQLEAALAQAIATRDGAKQAWTNAKAAMDNPQELNARIATARPQVLAAEARLARLRAGATEAEREAARAALAQAKARLDEIVKGATPEQLAIAERQLALARNQEYLAQANEQELNRRTGGGETVSPLAPLYSKDIGRAQLGVAWEATKLVEAQVEALKAPASAERLAQAQAAVDQAQAQLRRLEQGPTAEEVRVAEMEVAAAKANLSSLLEMLSNPQSARALVDAAYAQWQAAEAAVAAAEARLEAGRKGATPQQLAAAQAQVRQAEAALAVLSVQMEKSTPRAPRDGVILERLVNAGESVVPGSRLATVASLDEVYLTIYVPETQVGRVRLGQAVSVGVDSYPGEVFTGKVVHIADKAEYTPRNVQSPRERTNTVFAVKVALANADQRLKPGMPADATIRW